MASTTMTGVERTVRIAAGVYLLGKGIASARWNPLGWAQGAVGGGLLWSGVTGYGGAHKARSVPA